MAGNTNALSVSKILIARRSHFTLWKLAVGAFKAYGHQWQAQIGRVMWDIGRYTLIWLDGWAPILVTSLAKTDLDRSLVLHVGVVPIHPIKPLM